MQGSQTQNWQISGRGHSVLGLNWQQHSLCLGPWWKSASYQAQGMTDALEARGTVDRALFPKCHSHDSLTSESFPFLLSFSPSLHSTQLQFPFCIFFFSIHQSPQRAGDALQPPVSCDVGFQLLDAGPGAICLGGLWGGAGPGREKAASSGLVRASSLVSRSLFHMVRNLDCSVRITWVTFQTD